MMPYRTFALLMLVSLGVVRADVEVLWGITGVGGSPSSLCAINPATGALIGQLPTGTSGLSGISRHPVTGVLYATDSQELGSGAPKNLYTLNPVTGAATTVALIGFPIADTAFRADGTLFAWTPNAGANPRRLHTINLTTGVATLLANTPSTFGSSAITFGPGSVFYMVRSNGLITVNATTGALATGPLAITLNGADSSVDNLLATRANGTIYAGRRNEKAAPTTIFTLNPATAALTVVGSANLALTGMDFGTAAGPTGFKAAKKIVRVKTSTVTLKGRVVAPLFVTIAAKGKKATVKGSAWTLKKLKVRTGRTRVTLTCVDAMGQRAASVRVTVIRS